MNIEPTYRKFFAYNFSDKSNWSDLCEEILDWSFREGFKKHIGVSLHLPEGYMLEITSKNSQQCVDQFVIDLTKHMECYDKCTFEIMDEFNCDCIYCRRERERNNKPTRK